DPDGANGGSEEIAGVGPGNGPRGPPGRRGGSRGAEAAHVPAVRHLPVPHELGGLLDHETGRADGLLRAYSLGSDVASATPWGHSCAGVLPADLCQFCRPVRAGWIVLSMGRDWPEGVGRHS